MQEGHFDPASSTASPWIIDSGDSRHPLLATLQDKIVTAMRRVWKQLERVVVMWRKTGKWQPTGVGITMPREEKSGVNPENGAETVLALLVQWCEDYGYDVRISIQGHGVSTRGETVKQLFSVNMDGRELLDGEFDEPAEKKLEGKGLADVQQQAIEYFASMSFRAMDKAMELADKNIELSDMASKREEITIKAAKLEMKERERQREHEARMRDAATFDARSEQLMDFIGPIFGDVIKTWAVNKLNMPSGAANGPLSKRLRAVFDDIPDDKIEEVKKKLGPSWQILDDAAQGIPDEAFRELAQRFVDSLPDGEGARIMSELGPLIGQGCLVALAMIMKDAGVAA